MFPKDCNTPRAIIEDMLDILKEVVYQCLVLYINDLIIYLRMDQEHERDFKNILQPLPQQKFDLKEFKYHFSLEISNPSAYFNFRYITCQSKEV